MMTVMVMMMAMVMRRMEGRCTKTVKLNGSMLARPHAPPTTCSDAIQQGKTKKEKKTNKEKKPWVSRHVGRKNKME